MYGHQNRGYIFTFGTYAANRTITDFGDQIKSLGNLQQVGVGQSGKQFFGADKIRVHEQIVKQASKECCLKVFQPRPGGLRSEAIT